MKRGNNLSMNKVIKRNSKGRFVKGHPGFWLNKKRLHMMGEKHPLWKGDDVGYYAWHDWAESILGKANKCENIECIYPRKDARQKLMLLPKRYHLSSKSGLYLRNVEDIQMLCASCHMRYDRKYHWGTIAKIFAKDRTGSPSIRLQY